MVCGKILDQIMKHTKLDSFNARIYSIFCQCAEFDDPAIIIYSSIQQDIIEYVNRSGHNILMGDELYKKFEEDFLSKQLLGYARCENDSTYLYIKGYNYFNDPKFYVAAREIGEQSWNQRIPVSSLFNPTLRKQEPYLSLKENCEFKDAWVYEKLREISN